MPELLTAAEAAAERGVSPSRMRDLIWQHGVQASSRRPGRRGANEYPAEELRAIPGPNQGARHDLTGHRIGEMLNAARTVAEARGTCNEHDRIMATCLDGNPGSVAALLAATHRWTKRRIPGEDAEIGAAVRLVEQLATTMVGLPEILPTAVRYRVATAYSAARVRVRAAE